MKVHIGRSHLERKAHTKSRRIERLRTRLANIPQGDEATEGLIDIIKGVLDLLEEDRNG